jgi:hypothetical protein
VSKKKQTMRSSEFFLKKRKRNCVLLKILFKGWEMGRIQLHFGRRVHVRKKEMRFSFFVAQRIAQVCEADVS